MQQRTLLIRVATVAMLVALAACSRPAPPVVAAAVPAPIEVKVVVVTMFEIGNDFGDAPAEFQLWRERQKLDKQIPFAHHHDLFLNETTGVLGMVTGMGSINSATAVMALALDPRFDLSKAYWLVAGIAGVDPADASIGSAAWAEWLVDGDLAHEIDAREIPKDWPTGYFARNSKRPYDPNIPVPDGEVMRLNPALTEWAFQKTRDVKLDDDAGLQAFRARYKGFPNAMKPPSVLKGDNMAAMTFWHGKLLNDWANDYTNYWTKGQGNFVTSAMEDTGTYQSLAYVTPTGKVDKERLLVLRTASNYTMPPTGVTAATNLLAENEGYSGLGASVEAAYRVGSVIVDDIVAHWDDYREKLPAAP
jgi:purine nucleoside permease